MKKISVKIAKNKSVSLSYLEIKGRLPGPTCVISAGIHGNEINGIALVKKFIDYLEADNIPKHLQGRLFILPLINESGFQKLKRKIQYDQKDLNRVFGKKGLSASYKIAAALMINFYSKCDFVLDCHDSGSRSILIPHSRITPCTQEFCDLESRRLAMAFNSPIIVERQGKGGMLALELPHKYGIPTLTIEIGGALRLFPDYLEKGLAGIKNILAYKKMLPIPFHKPGPQFYLKDRFGIVAKANSVVNFDKKLGTRVHLGDLIGQMYLPDHNQTIPLKSPMCGIIFSMQYHNTAQKGKVMYSVLEDQICHVKKRSTLSLFEEIRNITM